MCYLNTSKVDALERLAHATNNKGRSECPRFELFGFFANRHAWRILLCMRTSARVTPRKICCQLALTIIPLFIITVLANSQSPEKKVEVGVQSTSLTIFYPDFGGDTTQPGFGGRVTYNINRSIAAEAEINLFPQKGGFGLGGGRAIQGQFGAKVGKRFEKLGIFAKARPGFLSISDVFSFDPNVLPFFLRMHRETHFTIDIGGVLELYPSKRTLVRFDAGDTIIRYGSQLGFSTGPQVVTLPSKIKHNFQFTAGMGFRLGHIDDLNAGTGSSDTKTPRYEIGMQFTSVSVNPPRPLCFDLCFIPRDPPAVTEPGLGGRFTFNLTRHIAFEAESNWFTRDHGTFAGPGGHMFQGQFGVKAGKRFEKWGVFGKARPGFMGFTKVIQLVGTHPFDFGGFPTIQGDFRVGTKLYRSVDLGGVIEFYVSRRIMTRMDLGDTIIHYGEYAVSGFPVSAPILRRPPETHHNFQFTAGIGFRF